MVDNYLNQSLVWEHITGVNEYNEPLSSVVSNIKARKEAGFKLVRNAQGEEIVSSAVFFTKSAVVVNDKIDSKLVISSEPMPQLDGSIMFYEVYLI